MRNRTSLLAAAVVILTGLTACDDSTAELNEPEAAAQIPDGAASVSFEVLEELTTPISAIMDRRRLVIGADSEWETFWNEFTGALVPQPNPPAVNFETQMVIAATMGQRTSGGYSISIDQVAEKDGTLYAAVRETSPDAMCSNIAVMTAPAVAAVVPRHDGDFAFVESEETLACDP